MPASGATNFAYVLATTKSAKECVPNNERITPTAVMYARQVPAPAYCNHVIPALMHMGDMGVDMRVSGRSTMQTSNL
jgi:hypothetical protein